MFYYIKGTLVYTDFSSAVIDTGGVAYKMTVSTSTLQQISCLKNDVKLYTPTVRPSPGDRGTALQTLISLPKLQPFGQSVSGMQPITCPYPVPLQEGMRRAYCKKFRSDQTATGYKSPAGSRSEDIWNASGLFQGQVPHGKPGFPLRLSCAEFRRSPPRSGLPYGMQTDRKRGV